MFPTSKGGFLFYMWSEIVAYLKNDCPVHVWMSSGDGWAYLSHKTNRMRIDSTWTLTNVKYLVNKMTQQ